MALRRNVLRVKEKPIYVEWKNADRGGLRSCCRLLVVVGLRIGVCEVAGKEEFLRFGNSIMLGKGERLQREASSLFVAMDVYRLAGWW